MLGASATGRGTANEVSPEPLLYVEREHSWPKCVFMASGLSLCITVDILQYSMPLAFLPSVLEDRGHSTMKIATAIGIYYWTGFLGGAFLTSYQIWRVLYEKHTSGQETPYYETVLRHIKYLIIGLGIGTVTLFLQALQPSWLMHVCCRFVQGFAGAYIFFYTFLLSVALFKGQQQVVAMTFASCALNVAEVFGSFLGAVLFDLWGQRTVFWFLGVVSIVNQFFLVAILYLVRGTEMRQLSARIAPSSRRATPTMLDMGATADPDAAGGPVQPPELQARTCGCVPRLPPGACDRFSGLLMSRDLICAVVLIATAAVVKGSVEEMLPFHADHRWGYDPMEIGRLFCTVAIAYILAAGFVGQCWSRLGSFQIIFSAYWLFMLGLVAWMAFACISYFRDSFMLLVCLSAYGICLGMTHTPAALLLASAIDHEEGAAKDAVNGIWNTMWEFGGSVGFLLGGLLAERYHEQMALLTGYTICCAAAAFTMVTVASWPEDGCGCINPEKDVATNYGSVA